MTRPIIVVVGTGIAGASTAYALARKGVRVSMLDAGYPGQATAAGAGIIQPWSSTADGAFYELYAAGADYYPTLIGRLAASGVQEIGYRQCGALVVNRDPAVLDQVAARLAARRESAPQMGTVSRLDNAELRRLFPPLAADLTGLHISGGARVDGRTLRDALLAGARHHGARSIAGTARLAHSAPSAAVRVETDDGVVPGDAVVVAAGAWTNALLAPLGVRLPIEPQKGQITHLRLAGVDTSHWPSVHPVASHYLVAFDDSRIVVGATRETGSGFDTTVTAGGQHRILADALDIAPGLAGAAVVETRVGLRPLTDNELPSIGAIPEVPGLFINAGFGAAGLTIGPYAGELLSELVLADVLADGTGNRRP